MSLARQGPKGTPSGRTRAVSQAMRDVAKLLGNTPAIARKSYVDPRLVDHYNDGLTIDPGRLDSAETEVRALLFRDPS